MITGGALVESGSNQAFGQLYGTATPGKLFVAAEGTIPERHRQGAIVGPGIAATLDLQVGSMIDVETNSYRVIAILESPEGFSTVQPETAVVLPPGEFREESVSQVIVEASSGRAASDVATQIRSVLNPRQPRVTVFELSTVVSQINDFFGLLSAFLAGLGGISLVVAGVAILNIMLVTTVERRTEIGVMRAVGIQREDVLRLILAEATMLGVVGSILGSLVSVGLVAVLYLAVPQVELGVVLDPSNAWYLAVATGVGIVISLLSGVYPAYRAATERPVDALRG
jgi:putative ABC transport system permease protein